MTKQEFEQLIGREATDEEYINADAIYMGAGSMTRQEVCAEIREHPFLLESKTVSAILTESFADKRRMAAIENERSKLRETLLSIAELIPEDAAAWNEISDLIGRKAVVIYKLGHDLPLLPDDVAYIKTNLE